MNLFIYLSGSIPKSHANEGAFVWTSEDMEVMRSLFLPKGIDVTYLNPLSRTDDLSDIKSLFGRDLLQVYLSHCVLVDAREKRGLGVGYEIAFANFQRIPVISWTPKGSHYRPSEMTMLGQELHDWEHPFVKIPSMRLVEDLPQAVEVASTLNFANADVILPSEEIWGAMQHYITTNLLRDHEMYDLICTHAELREKLEKIGLELIAVHVI